MTAAVAARNVHYAVGGKSLVHGIDLAVARGEMLVVLGPNGAGKSTLLRLLAGEIGPTGGAVFYGGQDIAALPPWRLALVRAVLPQAAQVAFPFRVREVVQLGLDSVGRRLTATARGDILAQALAEGDVAHLEGRTYDTLSGGERQRVQFARVLAQLRAGMAAADGFARMPGQAPVPTPVLLLDEPVSNLDLKHQSGLLVAARRLAGEGVAVIAILHDLNLAALFADRIVVLDVGRLVADGAPADVLTDGLLQAVFDAPFRVGVPPPPPVPYVLPYRADTA
ncbi:heme ABC transporter ATP-binding protein [Pseudochelatococcus sp. B33]